jgi:orotate phosphoribosyltransferase
MNKQIELIKDLELMRTVTTTVKDHGTMIRQLIKMCELQGERIQLLDDMVKTLLEEREEEDGYEYSNRN